MAQEERLGVPWVGQYWSNVSLTLQGSSLRRNIHVHNGLEVIKLLNVRGVWLCLCFLLVHCRISVVICLLGVTCETFAND